MEWKSGGLKRRERAEARRRRGGGGRRRREEGSGGREKVGLWSVAAVSSLNLQCGVMDCEETERRGNKVMSMRTEDKLI